MVEQSQRSYLREASGPRAIEPIHRGDKHRSTTNRRHKDGDDRDKQRSSRKTDSNRSTPKKESSNGSSSHRRKPSSPQPTQPTSPVQDRPELGLAMLHQPTEVVQLGMPVETSVIIGLKRSPSGRIPSTPPFDTSELFAVTSLVADTRTGERVSLEPEYLSGQKSLDSIHPLPEHLVESLSSAYPDLRPLGYFSFPGLVIRQAGTFCIRTTLITTSEAGATALTMVDSKAIRVERRLPQLFCRNHR